MKGTWSWTGATGENKTGAPADSKDGAPGEVQSEMRKFTIIFIEYSKFFS